MTKDEYKKVREDFGYSQKEWLEKMGISIDTHKSYSSGRLPVSQRVANLIEMMHEIHSNEPALLDASRIKAIIKNLGWTSKEVAAYWGMTEGWLSKLVQNKNGERSVRDDCAFRGLPRK